MKITETQLRDMALEELTAMMENGEIDEGMMDRLKARASGVGTKLKGGARGMVQKGLGALAGVAGEDDMASQMKDKAAATKGATADKALAKKTISILQSHIKDIQNDLQKLGIDPTTPGVKGALHALQKAVSGTIAKRAGE